MAKKPISLPQQRDFLETKRRDTWWLFPAITFAYFMAFIIYSTWGAFQGEHYWFAGTTDGPGFAAAEHVFSADEAAAIPGGGFQSQYLSPFYAPTLFRLTHLDDEPIPGVPPVKHTWFGEWPDWLHAIWPPLMPLTPAVLILWAPGIFRFTCYYYRGAYYKAFWMDPVNCAVGEPRATYWGERKLPLILQNVHRYTLYIALIFIVILTYDGIISFIFVEPASGEWRLGVGVGSIILILNALFLALYTFGCHSFRHLIGGRKDCVSTNKVQYETYKCVSCMNRWHMQWAWVSLFWVGFADLYVRMCSMGIWTDYRILF